MRTCHALCISATSSTSKTDRLTAGTPIGVKETSLILSAVAVDATLHLLGADVVLTELELWAGRVRLAGALTDALQAELFRDTITIAAAKRTTDSMSTNAALRTLCVLLTILQRYTSLLGISGTA